MSTTNVVGTEVHWVLLTLSRKTAPQHNISTSVVDCGDGVLWVTLSISLPPNTVGRVHASEVYFGVI